MAVKPKIAIYDFTDCEGCEVILVSLREKILDIENRLDIADWRLGQERKDKGPFLVSIIEGTPITPDEVETLKYLRENSTYIVALGACASIAGVPGIMPKEKREEWYKKIYGENYKPKGIDALPLSAYVKVDYMIHGCPANGDELAKTIEDLLAGKPLSYRPYSVCFECKEAGNKCRIVSGQPCLGPITQGGCKAACVSGGSPCYGCFGFRESAEIDNLIKTLKKITTPEEIKLYFEMFQRQSPEWQSRKDKINEI
jgi:coenzyme F420-reducing hydrogenase gamma subunit